MAMKITFEIGDKKATFEIDLAKIESMLADMPPKEAEDEPRSMETEGLGAEDYIKTFIGNGKGALPKDIRLDEQDVNFQADREAVKASGRYRFFGGEQKVWRLKPS